MKLHEFAKSINVPFKLVSDAAKALEMKANANAILSEQEYDRLRAELVKADSPEVVEPDSIEPSTVETDEAGQLESLPVIEPESPGSTAETDDAGQLETSPAGDDAQTDEPTVPEVDLSRFDGSDFFPRRIYKYAKKRGLTLEAVIHAAHCLHMHYVHRHRDLSDIELQQLDAYFLNAE